MPGLRSLPLSTRIAPASFTRAPAIFVTVTPGGDVNGTNASRVYPTEQLLGLGIRRVLVSEGGRDLE